MESDNAFLDYSFINFLTTESLLTTSQYAKVCVQDIISLDIFIKIFFVKVIFHNIKEKYNYHEDLICTYSLTEQFVVKTGGRIVLFKLGWQEATDYVLFEWVESPAVKGNPLQVNFKGIIILTFSFQLMYMHNFNSS